MGKSTAEGIIRGQLETEAEHVDYLDLSNDELLTMLGRALCDVGLVPRAPALPGASLSEGQLQSQEWFDELLKADEKDVIAVGDVIADAARFEPWRYGTGELQAAWSRDDVTAFFGRLWRLGRNGMDYVLETLCLEMCSPDGSGLKTDYQELFSPLGGNSPLVQASTVIILILAPSLAVPAVALPAAAWLLRVGAGNWCRKCAG